MSNTRVKWTKEDDEILVQAIKANPQNKAAAFRETAIKTDHSAVSCSARWYNVLNNPENKHYVGSLFTLIGHKSKFDNIKSNTTTKSNILNKIKNKIVKTWMKLRKPKKTILVTTFTKETIEKMRHGK